MAEEQKIKTQLIGHEGPEEADSGHVTPEIGLGEQGCPVYPKIPKVFIGKSVLVTGATGFLGKVLVEKLLRSCPGIKELFILIRPTIEKDVESRLDDYRKHHVFDRLRDEKPDALNKLRALSGDVTLDDAGLSGWQLQKVITEVSFVFHCAANVRFDDEPRNTFCVNLVGVKNILDLCKVCQKLEALVHVSTAYSFCNHPVISEQIYTEFVRPEQVYESTRWMNNEQLRILGMHYIQGRPSLYHFSKALAEILLIKSEHDVPTIIVRPSIVTASVEEPFPGWIDNYNGPSGFIHVCGKGVVRTLLVDPKANADWVPVDIVANTLIAAANYVVTKNEFGNPQLELSAENGIAIINCTCPDNNIITWMKVVNICLPLLIKYPSIDVYRKPGGTVTASPIIYFLCRMTYHYLPALLIDCVSCLVWKKPLMIRLYNRIHRVMGHLEYYTTRSFTFSSPNMRKLVEYMDPDDRKDFPIDQSTLNWDQYMENYVLGVRRYFSRESDLTLLDARRRMMWFQCLWLAIKLSSLFGGLMFMRFLHRRGILKTAHLIPRFAFAPFSLCFNKR